MESAAVLPVAGQNSSNIGQIFEIVCKFFKILIIYYTSHGTPHDVLVPQNLGWETLLEILTSSLRPKLGVSKTLPPLSVDCLGTMTALFFI